tara:strand:+ start:135 stop:776 length:642 start_codon:yes stop_codon:yes gene_type:complete
MSLIDLINKKTILPDASEALKGREIEMEVPEKHFIKETQLKEPFPKKLEKALFGMGCFWGVEKKFWELKGVYSTAVGYSGGETPNPSYKEVCSGMTGHNEAVLVIYDPKVISFDNLLTIFWEEHDPTQGMRQGNDIGTQYRSGIYYFNEQQKKKALETKELYQQKLKIHGFSSISTEVIKVKEFYYAEHYHQQYLGKNPEGYCGIEGTGVTLF